MPSVRFAGGWGCKSTRPLCSLYVHHMHIPHAAGFDRGPLSFFFSSSAPIITVRTLQGTGGSGLPGTRGVPSPSPSSPVHVSPSCEWPHWPGGIQRQQLRAVRRPKGDSRQRRRLIRRGIAGSWDGAPPNLLEPAGWDATDWNGNSRLMQTPRYANFRLYPMEGRESRAVLAGLAQDLRAPSTYLLCSDLQANTPSAGHSHSVHYITTQRLDFFGSSIRECLCFYGLDYDTLFLYQVRTNSSYINIPSLTDDGRNGSLQTP